MKLQLFSDLHLEFADFKPDCSEAHIIVLAGDIHVGTKALTWIAAQNFTQPVIYVLGNHEYYKNTYPKLIHKLKEQVPSHVHILENDTFEVHNVVFHGATLWSDFELFGTARLSGAICQAGMNDFKYIRREPTYSKMRSIDVALIHTKTRQWLAESLKTHQGKTNIVITHHAPSLLSLPEKRRTHALSPSYASHLDEFIQQYQPHYWLHGHIHHSQNYKIGHCQILSNPRGYPDEPNLNFNPNFIIEINA